MISTRALYIAAFLSLCAVLATVIFAVRSVARRQRLGGAASDADENPRRSVRATQGRARRSRESQAPLPLRAEHKGAALASGYTMLVQGILLGAAAVLLVQKLAEMQPKS